MPTGLVRVSHGWWKPESEGTLTGMSGMWDFSDAALTAGDDPELNDTEQGVSQLKGMRCALAKLSAAEAVERPGQRPQADPRDFMYDALRAEDVECDAVQLSMHGRTSEQYIRCVIAL